MRQYRRAVPHQQQHFSEMQVFGRAAVAAGRRNQSEVSCPCDQRTQDWRCFLLRGECGDGSTLGKRKRQITRVLRSTIPSTQLELDGISKGHQ